MLKAGDEISQDANSLSVLEADNKGTAITCPIIPLFVVPERPRVPGMSSA